MPEESLRHNLSSPWDQPELAESLATQPGVGKARQNALAQKGLFTLGDVLWWLPVAYEDRKLLRAVSELREKEFALLELTLQSSRAWGPGGRGWRMEFSDAGGEKIAAIWFRFNRPYINGFQTGQVYLLAGQAAKDRQGKWCMAHPKLYQGQDKDQAGAGRIWPVYADVPGLAPANLRGLISSVAAAYAPKAPDFLYERLPRDIYPLPLGQALLALHQPDNCHHGHFAQARQSLVVDELFYFELALSLRRQERGLKQAAPLAVSTAALESFAANLPYPLTIGQRAALGAIAEDMGQSTPMLRLLCGDVGTGKTAVALGAAAACALAGGRCAFMAPTEILARQHWQNAKNFLEPLGIGCSLLLGGNKNEGKASGRAGLVIGTQALLWRKEELNDISLVIIDEQHRFGVGQRVSVGSHGTEPHLLVLSATPIPRSLALALSGYMDISDLPKRPDQHARVETWLAVYDERQKAFNALRQCLQDGHQAYVVCAHLHASEYTGSWDAVSIHKKLAGYFAPLEVGILHGKMNSQEQEAVLADFREGRVRLLVATTVVEVGVDVPAATTMLVLSSERFGLSQLHQLRGRVGRGSVPGQCWLLAGEQAAESSLQRLQTLCHTDDGLAIAQADLALRGPGETLGYKQSGLPPFRLANWITDAPLAARVREIIKEKNLAEVAALRQEALRRYARRLGLVRSG